jgi:hypothetical protein
MQLLKLIILDVSIQFCTAHCIEVVLVRDRAILPRARVLRRDHTLMHDILVVRGGALIIHVISGQTPATDLPQGAVIFIVVR